MVFKIIIILNIKAYELYLLTRNWGQQGRLLTDLPPITFNHHLPTGLVITLDTSIVFKYTIFPLFDVEFTNLPIE